MQGGKISVLLVEGIEVEGIEKEAQPSQRLCLFIIIIDKSFVYSEICGITIE